MLLFKKESWREGRKKKEKVFYVQKWYHLQWEKRTQNIEHTMLAFVLEMGKI